MDTKRHYVAVGAGRRLHIPLRIAPTVGNSHEQTFCSRAGRVILRDAVDHTRVCCNCRSAIPSSMALQREGYYNRLTG